MNRRRSAGHGRPLHASRRRTRRMRPFGMGLAFTAAIALSACGILFGGLPDLEVHTVTPSRGPAEGGVELTLRGTGFYEGIAGSTATPLEVTVCGAPLTGIVIDGTARNTLLPGGASVSILAGDAVTGTTSATTAYGPGDVTVTRPDGQTVTLEDAFDCYAPGPAIASFDFAPSTPASGDIVTFAWTAESVAGDDLTCSFDAGDGSEAVAITECHLETNASLTHVYAQSGTYAANLTVADEDGDTAAASTTVTVANSAPLATFTATPTSGYAPLDVMFDATASADADGSIATYAWDFGDGSTGSGPSATHTYATAGSYTATLTVTDDASATGSASTVIEAHEGEAPAVESFAATTDPVAVGGTTDLVWSVTGTQPITLSLTPGVGDVTGLSSTAVTPAATTTYTLSATNAFGSASAEVTVTVVTPPSASDDMLAVVTGADLAADLTADNGGGADEVGSPASQVVSFGAGDLGGTASDNPAGSSVPLAGGTLTLDADGALALASPAHAGTYRFDYRLENVAGADEGTVVVEVRHPPAATNDAFAGHAGVDVAGNLLDDNGGGSDELGYPTATLVSFGASSAAGHVAGSSTSFAGGVLTTGADGAFTLAGPTEGGIFTFLYRLENAAGASDATVTVTLAAAPAAATDGPYAVAAGDTLTVAAADSNDLLDNDDRGHPEAVVTHFGGGDAGGTVGDHGAGSTVPFAGGTLQVGEDGSFTVSGPAAKGTYTFSYRIANPSGTSDASVSIVVQDGPLANDDAFVVLHDASLAANVTGDNGNGADYLGSPAGAVASFGGGDLGGSVDSNAAGSTVSLAGGALSVGSDGTISLTATGAGLTPGAYSLRYRLENGAGASDATVAIDVHAPPTAADDALVTSLGEPLAADLTADNGGGADERGYPAASVVSFGGGDAVVTGGVTTLAGGTLTVDADGSLLLEGTTTRGTYSFGYRLENAAGGSDGTVTVDVREAPAPADDVVTVIVGDDLAADLLADNGSGADDIGHPAAAVSSFGGGDLGTAVTDHAPGATVALAGGTLTVGADGGLELTGASAPGDYAFTYRLTSAAGSGDASVTVRVWAPPTPANDAFTALLGNDLGENVFDDNGYGPDDRGFPLGTIPSFGGGSLGSDVATFPAGASATLAGGTLSIGMDGNLTLTGANTAGAYDLEYALANDAGSRSGLVSIVIYQPPTAVDDGPAPGSEPGDAFHVPMDTFVDFGPRILQNDGMGYEHASVESFGGGDLGGSVTDHAASGHLGGVHFGTSGQLYVDHNGFVQFMADDGFVGTFTFQYRLRNSVGFSDATVSIKVGAPPAAANDIYPHTVVGNTPIDTTLDSGFATLGNDGGDGVSIVAETVTSTNGGSATIASDGTFTYAPDAGFTGTDTFDYTLQNALGTDTGTVSITVAEMVWYVDRNASPGGDGTLNARFDNIQSLEAAAADGPGDVIFLYEGNYVCGWTLENGQQVLGHNSAESLPAMSGLAFPADSLLPPTTAGSPVQLIQSTGADCVVLAQDNTLRHLTVGDTGSGRGIVGAAFGTLTASSVDATGSGAAIDLSGGTLDVAMGTLASTSGTNNVRLQNVSGSLIAPAGALSGSTGAAFLVDGGDATITYGGTIANASGRSVDIQSTTGGVVTLSGAITDDGAGIFLASNAGANLALSGTLTLSTGSSDAFTFTGGGTLTVTGGSNTISTTTGTALTMAGGAIGGGGATFVSVSSNGAQSGISIQNVAGSLSITGDGVTAGSGGTVTNSTSDGILLSNTGSVSLGFMRVTYSQGHGIFATNPGSLTLTGAEVTDNGNTDPTVKSGIELASDGTSTGSVHVSGSTIDRNRTYGVHLRTGGASALGLTLHGNTLTDNRARPILLTFGSTAASAFTISDNATTGDFNANGIRIEVTDHDGGGVASGYAGSVTGNVMTLVPGGSYNDVIGNGLEAVLIGHGGAAIEIANNLVDGFGTYGFQVVAQEGTGRLDATVLGNTARNADAVNAYEGMLFRAGSSVGGDNTLCVDARNNESAGSSVDGYYVRQRGTATLELQGFTTDAESTLRANGNTTNSGPAEVLAGIDNSAYLTAGTCPATSP